MCCRGTRSRWDGLLHHPDVAAVSFVGSTPIARYVYERGTRAGKRVQALGGAKNHMVVLPDADLDLAADAAVSAAFGSAGERCMAISALVAVEPVGDELIEKIRTRISRLRVGPGTDERVEMGPLVTGAHRDKVASYLDSGVTDGAPWPSTAGPTRSSAGSPGASGSAPACWTMSPRATAPYDDEIFGPVLSVARVDTYAEAVELVNNSPYGNGTAVFTNDGGAARAGTRCSVTRTCTAPKASTSTPGARSSRPAGWTPATAASTWASRSTPDF